MFGLIFSSCFSLFSKDVRLPVQLQRAMVKISTFYWSFTQIFCFQAAEAEAAREARAKVREYFNVNCDGTRRVIHM